MTSTPAGINCGSGAGCEAEFEEGTEVTLSQAAASGSEFKEWSGACTGSGACKVTMSAAKAVGAKFDPIPRTLSITKAGTGTGEVKCKFNGGSARSLHQPLAQRHRGRSPSHRKRRFELRRLQRGNRLGASCSTSPCSFTIEANSTLTATFNLDRQTEVQAHRLQVGNRLGHRDLDSPPGSTAAPAQAVKHEFEEGTEVTLSRRLRRLGIQRMDRRLHGLGDLQSDDGGGEERSAPSSP